MDFSMGGVLMEWEDWISAQPQARVRPMAERPMWPCHCVYGVTARVQRLILLLDLFTVPASISNRTVFAGDLNAQSCQWDPMCHVQRNAAFWDEVIDKHGMQVLNDGQPAHYWTREHHKGESDIDLTLVNQMYKPRMKWFMLADDHTTRSDHKVIQWVVEADRAKEADHERVVGWQLAAMTQSSVSNGSG